MNIPEIYISIDVEADGPIPTVNSMLSFAAVAITIDKKVISTFERNLVRLPGAVEDKNTKEKFWDKFPDAYQKTRENMVEPKKAMSDYSNWLLELKQYGNIIHVGWPITYDFMWIHWYLMKFTGDNPAGWGGIDIRTAGAIQSKQPWTMATKGNLPQRWKDSFPHTHVALDDALEQGSLFINILRENQNLPPIQISYCQGQ